MEYAEEDYLQLSGIQHFIFCRRQWCLIHIEGLWTDNFLTVDGTLMHRKAHDPYERENRRGLVVSRAMPVFSREMGIIGECDIVEFRSDDKGIPLVGRDGFFSVFPIEYKRGGPKQGREDILQLTAQAMCLEEMLVTEISKGAIYYGETGRRMQVVITDENRSFVRSAFAEMHAIMRRHYTVKAKPKNGCTGCSMRDLCLPEALAGTTAARYNAENLGEKE